MHALYIIGPPGSGKSTLCNLLIHKLRQERPETFVFAHRCQHNNVAGPLGEMRRVRQLVTEGRNSINEAAISVAPSILLVDDVHHGFPIDAGDIDCHNLWSDMFKSDWTRNRSGRVLILIVSARAVTCAGLECDSPIPLGALPRVNMNELRFSVAETREALRLFAESAP